MMEMMQKTLEVMCTVQKDNSEFQRGMFKMFEDRERERSEQAPQQLFKREDGPTGEDTRRKMTRPMAVRPIIEEGVDDFSWNLFLDKWQRYKQAIGVESEYEMCAELRECCSPEVNRMLFEFIGGEDLSSTDMTEMKLLDHIKAVAVRSIHKEVHRYHFNQISQGESEKVAKFVGRLKAQAILCDFNVKCTCNERVSYAEEMVAQRLTSGAANPEHMTKVLGEAEELTTLKEKVNKMISLETTEEAANKIRSSQPSHANPMKTLLYKRDQKQKLVGADKKNLDEELTDRIPRRPSFRRSSELRRSGVLRKRRCRGCGRSSHPHGKSMSRTDCPAWGQKCNVCNKTGHFASVCKGRYRASFTYIHTLFLTCYTNRYSSTGIIETSMTNFVEIVKSVIITVITKKHKIYKSI